MQLVSGIAAVAALFAVSLVIGDLLMRLFGRGPGLCERLCLGFAALAAAFQIILFFPAAFSLSEDFSLLYRLTGGFVLVCLLLDAALAIAGRARGDRRARPARRRVDWVTALVVALIVLQAFLSCYLHKIDKDDGYYIAVSNIAVEQGRFFNAANYDFSYIYNGNALFPVENMPYFLSGWELLIACVAKAFCLHPAALARSFLPFFLIPTCYAAFYALGMRLLGERQRARMFLLVFVTLGLFGSFDNTGGNAASFLLMRSYHGKSMLPNLIFPLLLCGLTDVYARRETRFTWFLLGLALLAGTGVSVTGLYLGPMYFLVMGIPHLIRLLAERGAPVRARLRGFGAVVAKAFLCALPAACVVVAGFLYTRGASAEAAQAGEISLGYWSYLLAHHLIPGGCLAMFLAAAVLLGRMRAQRPWFVLLLGGTLSLLATLLNPFLAGPIAAHITGAGVYWRVCWMFPAYVTIALAATLGLFRLSDGYAATLRFKGGRTLALEGARLRSAAAAALLAAIALCGSCCYFRFFQPHSTLERVPEETRRAVDYVLTHADEEMPTLLLPTEYSWTARVYTSRVDVVVSRPTQAQAGYLALYDLVYGEGDIGSAEARALLEEMSVEYILASAEMETGGAPYERALEIGERALYRRTTGDVLEMK